jgi:flagellar hook-length control protein FliK
MATQHYVVHAQAWPGQTFEWEIDDPDHRRGGDDTEDGENWHTTLRMTMPKLGGIEAELHLSAAGVALRLRVDTDETRVALDAARPELEAALAGVGIALTGFVAERSNEQA